MARAERPAGQPAKERWHQVDVFVQRFEKAWQSGGRPIIDDFLPKDGPARLVAGLDHPNIVPVYDVGSTEDHPFFVVSKFIEGGTLVQRIKENRPSVLEATELVAAVAYTLHYAHTKTLIHRDIKPGNILLE